MFAVSQIVSDCLRFCWCIILPAAGSKLPTVLRVLAADAAGCADVEKVGVLSQWLSHDSPTEKTTVSQDPWKAESEKIFGAIEDAAL